MRLVNIMFVGRKLNNLDKFASTWYEEMWKDEKKTMFISKKYLIIVEYVFDFTPMSIVLNNASYDFLIINTRKIVHKMTFFFL